MASPTALPPFLATLELEGRPENMDQARDAIRRELSTLHPDRKGGEFSSDEDRERFHQLTDALRRLDAPASTAVVPISELPTLLAAIRDIASPPAQDRAALARTEFRTLARDEIHHRSLLPRISSGVIGSVTAFLFAIGGQVKDDPVLGTLLSTQASRIGLLALTGYAAVAFLMTWFLEQREAARAEWLASEEGRRMLLQGVLERKSLDQTDPSGNGRRFSFSELVEAIQGRERHSLAVPLMRTRLSVGAAETLARAHVEELENRGVVTRVPGPTLDIEYEVVEAVATDLLSSRARVSRLAV